MWPPSQEHTSYLYEKPCTYVRSKKPLGTGSFSTVFECKNTNTGMHYAAKQYRKRYVYGLEEALRSEFEILKQVSNTHPNLLTLIDYFETEDDLYLVTDLARGGELFDRIVNSPTARLPEHQAVQITKTLVNTINFLHLNNIVHRDLKAENLLFLTKNTADTSLLVADFGLARLISRNTKLHETCGTLNHMAPEMFDKDKGHSFPVDMWALGVIVYFMLCGYMPFDCETDDETKHAILTGDYMFEPPEYWDGISAGAKDFISKCFELDPAKRLTAEDAVDHVFVKGMVRARLALLTPQSLSRTPSSSNMSANAGFRASHTNLTALSSSSVNLAKLRESLAKIQQNQQFRPLLPTKSESSTNISPMPSNLSLLQKSRALSLADLRLQGDRCVSPDQVSQFTTPLGSALVSRNHSYNSIEVCVGQLDTECERSTAKFFL